MEEEEEVAEELEVVVVEVLVVDLEVELVVEVDSEVEVEPVVDLEEEQVVDSVVERVLVVVTAPVDFHDEIYMCNVKGWSAMHGNVLQKTLKNDFN